MNISEKPEPGFTLRQKKLQLIYGQSWLAIPVSLAIAGLAAAIVKDYVSMTMIIAWLLVHTAVASGRGILFIKYNLYSQATYDGIGPERVFFLTLLLPVSLWGIGSVLLAMGAPVENQIAIYLILLGLAAGSVSAYYPFPYIVITVLAIELLPMTLMFLVSGGVLQIQVALVTLTFFAISIRASLLQAATLDENYSLNALLTNSNREMTMLATTDFLTGIGNRRYFLTAAEAQLRFCMRHGLPVSLLLLDLDNFKQINDTYGHQMGDLVLQQAAKAIQTSLRTSELSARFGGEEFIVLLPATDVKGAMVVAEKIRSNMEGSTFGDSLQRIRVTTSIGVTGGNVSIEQMIAAADTALYRAKNEGRNRVFLASKLDR